MAKKAINVNKKDDNPLMVIGEVVSYDLISQASESVQASCIKAPDAVVYLVKEAGISFQSLASAGELDQVPLEYILQYYKNVDGLRKSGVAFEELVDIGTHNHLGLYYLLKYHKELRQLLKAGAQMYFGDVAELAISNEQSLLDILQHIDNTLTLLENGLCFRNLLELAATDNALLYQVLLDPHSDEAQQLIGNGY